MQDKKLPHAAQKLVYGTWQLADKHWPAAPGFDAPSLLRTAFQKGLRCLDLAESYGRGRCEELIGQAFTSEEKESLFIISKVSPTHLHYSALIDSCYRSLRRLGRSYVDLYLIHWPSGSFGTRLVEIEETCEALNILLQRGLVREVGVSNVTLAQLVDYQKFIEISAVQNCYSLLWRYPERDLLPYCVENQIAFLAYSPFAQGLLLGKQRKNLESKDDIRFQNKLFNKEREERYLQVATVLREVSSRLGVSCSAVALKWCQAQGTLPVFGARSESQLVQNLESLSITLATEDLSKLNQASCGAFEGDTFEVSPF